MKNTKKSFIASAGIPKRRLVSDEEEEENETPQMLFLSTWDQRGRSESCWTSEGGGSAASAEQTGRHDGRALPESERSFIHCCWIRLTNSTGAAPSISLLWGDGSSFCED